MIDRDVTALDKGMADCHGLVATNVTVRYYNNDIMSIMLYSPYIAFCRALQLHVFTLARYSQSLRICLSLPLNYRPRDIADCSHWVQQDAPEEVNQFMREFLQE